MNNNIIAKIILIILLFFYLPTIISLFFYIKLSEKVSFDINLILIITFTFLAGLLLFYVVALSKINLIGINNEIKKFKDETDSVRVLNKKISNTFMSLIHDIKNTLTVVSGYVSTILQYNEDFEEEKKKDFLKRIRLESDGLSKLLKDYLNTLNQGENLEDILFSDVDIIKIINYYYSIFEGKARKKNIDYKLNIASEIPSIYGNKSKLEFVISNLISNAFNIGAENGKIAIEVKKENKNLSFAVSSTYKKISKIKDKVVFERHKKKNKTIDDKTISEFNQLGLYTSKMIIERHNGKLDFKDDTQNRLKIFYFVIPMEKK